MKISINSLYWDNISPKIYDSHRMVMSKFDIPIKYNCSNISHGFWMDLIMKNVVADIYVFFDIDCVPITREAYDASLDYVIKHNTFIGNAQVSNHIEPKNHIFAAPSFFAISRECYYKLGAVSFIETHRSDVAEELSYVADSMNIGYKCIYPTKFDAVSETDGIWNLANYGVYGIGTVFENKFYHLFQSRIQKNVDLFVNRCNQIATSAFNTDGMHDSVTYNRK